MTLWSFRYQKRTVFDRKLWKLHKWFTTNRPLQQATPENSRGISSCKVRRVAGEWQPVGRSARGDDMVVLTRRRRGTRGRGRARWTPYRTPCYLGTWVHAGMSAETGLLSSAVDSATTSTVDCRRAPTVDCSIVNYRTQVADLWYWSEVLKTHYINGFTARRWREESEHEENLNVIVVLRFMPQNWIIL